MIETCLRASTKWRHWRPNESAEWWYSSSVPCETVGVVQQVKVRTSKTSRPAKVRQECYLFWRHGAYSMLITHNIHANYITDTDTRQGVNLFRVSLLKTLMASLLLQISKGIEKTSRRAWKNASNCTILLQTQIENYIIIQGVVLVTRNQVSLAWRVSHLCSSFDPTCKQRWSQRPTRILVQETWRFWNLFGKL